MKKAASKKGTPLVKITGLKKKHELKDDPFFKEKHRRAAENLKKNPPPEWLLKEMGVTKPWKFKDLD